MRGGVRKADAQAGLPDGAFKNLYATRSQIEMILNDPRVQGVALTGSEGAGAIDRGRAGKALKKSTMELGGADAFVVLADADLEKTVKWAVFGRHWNGGQVCVSSKRMIIVDEIYDQFLDRYRRRCRRLAAGRSVRSKTTLAPLSSKAPRTRSGTDPPGRRARRDGDRGRAAGPQSAAPSCSRRS